MYSAAWRCVNCDRDPCIISETKPYLSIIIPTLREADNLRPLTEQVFGALSGVDYPAEMIIIDDDSRDGTDAIVADLAEQHPVRLVVRVDEKDLSTAVLRGFDEAAGDVFLVMDADLSHPPASVPALVEPIRADRADFVIGSRRVEGGSIENWPWFRHLTSRVAAALARGVTEVRDPMAGFFCLKRDVWRQCGRLRPIGYKIALELLVRSGVRRVVEVPITFTDRAAGKSKMRLKTHWDYLRHLSRLYAYRIRRR